jgi:hypothetical protein
MLALGLVEGADFDQDFHAIQHWGQEPAMSLRLTWPSGMPRGGSRNWLRTLLLMGDVTVRTRDATNHMSGIRSRSGRLTARVGSWPVSRTDSHVG